MKKHIRDLSKMTLLAFTLINLAPALAVADTPAKTEGWEMRDKILARIKRPALPVRDFAITDYGAKPGDGMNARPAIIAAIDACAAAGGGRVVIPAGLFLSNGPIHLKSNVNLHVSEGATLKFSSNIADYLPVVLTRWEGIICYNYSPLIYARNQINIAITGKGTIDGSGKAGFAKLAEHQQPDRKKLWQMGADKTPVEQRIFGGGHFLRPGGIEPYECEGVLIEGVRITDMPFWCVHPMFCKNVTVDGIRVESMTENNDGCDPDSCTDVLIQNCYFATGDDSIAIKSGRDSEAWALGRATENVVIRGCIAAGKINAFAIGSEMSGSVRNVFIEDCRVVCGTNAIYTKGNSDRGGVVENVRVRRIKLETVRDTVIRFETNYHSWRGGSQPPVFRNFLIEDVYCQSATAYGVYFDGQPGEANTQPTVHDVILRRVTIDKAKAPSWIRNISDITFENVRINGIQQPAIPAFTSASVKKLKIGD